MDSVRYLEVALYLTLTIKLCIYGRYAVRVQGIMHNYNSTKTDKNARLRMKIA